jgi:DNA-binding CsgD family transcriptional regulator
MEPRRWQLILNEAQKLVNADTFDVSTYDFRHHTGSVLVHSGLYQEKYLKSYESHYAHLNPWLRREDKYRQEEAVWLGRELMPRDHLIRTVFYNEWLRPQDLHHRSAGVVCRHGTEVLYLSTLRSRRSGAFERHELYPLQKLIPHIGQVVELRRLFGCYGSLGDHPLLEQARQLREGLILAGPQAKVLGTNARAEDMLATDGALTLVKGRLGGATERDTMALRDKMDAALATARGQGDDPGGPVALRGRDGDRLSVNVVPLPPDSAPGEQEPAVAVIARTEAGPVGRAKGTSVKWRPLVIREAPDRVPTEVWEPDGEEYAVVEPEDQAEANAERLRRLYELTPAEARLAVRIACGYSLQQAAAAQGVSITTVRTHLQRIFDKTDTHHQAALVSLLVVGPARLRLACVGTTDDSVEYG